MSAKRRAETDLNHDNWDREDGRSDEEDSRTGPFKRASEEELSKRKMKVARRRSEVVTTGGHEGPSVFKNFSGFGNIGAGGSKDVSFDFGQKKTDSFGSASKIPFGFGKLGDSSSGEKKMFEASSFKVPSSLQTSSVSMGGSFTFSSNSPSSSSSCSSNKENSEPTNGARDAKSSPTTITATGSSEGNNTAYLSSLRSLNEGVLKWIQKHLDDNINVNLNPVFDDYKKHFEELQQRYKPKFTKNKKEVTGADSSSSKNGDASPGKQSQLIPTSNNLTPKITTNKSDSIQSRSPKTYDSVKSGPSPFASKDTKSPEIPKFSFSSTELKPLEPSTKLPFLSSDPPKFPFGSSTLKSKETGSTFSFGSSTSTQDKDKGGFSFGGSTTGLAFGVKESNAPVASGAFSFSSGSSGFSVSGASGFNPKPATKSGTSSHETEEDAPPQPEIVEVKEDDAVYEKKCKLFYKKDGTFTEKGLGTLFLKPVPDSEKTQLVVRAATNLGNLLLNILLNPKLPAQRMGKNNVLIVCVPNPPLETSGDSNVPVSMLIRVKTGEDADELLKKIDEYKCKE